MNAQDREIFVKLQIRPDHMYITPDGSALYVLVEGGMLCFTGPNFRSMSEEEVNEFLQDAISQLKK